MEEKACDILLRTMPHDIVNNLRPLLMLVIGLAPCCAVAALAQDTMTVTTNYYTVEGSSPRELRASLDQSRSLKDRSPSDARTDWDIRWAFQTISSDTECRLRSVEIRTTITITLPRWVASSNATPDLQQRWQDYMKALVKHEDGHRVFAQLAASEVGKQLRSIKVAANCDALAESIKTKANATIDEYHEKEAQYDRKTEHGATQGARFP